MSTSGIYIVTLNNETPISVNAHDPRVAQRAVAVTRMNCKLGKARSLEVRRRNYEKTFGAENVNFFAIAEVDDIALAERSILARLHEFRVLGKTRRKNEWLVGIEPAEVERIALAALREAGLTFRLIGSVAADAA
jgi:hypothetical protein